VTLPTRCVVIREGDITCAGGVTTPPSLGPDNPRIVYKGNVKKID